MQREHLEQHQVWIYLCAIALGWGLAHLVPHAAPMAEWLLWPALALLLLATFAQTPLRQLPLVLAQRRLLAALVVGNFVLLPLLVACLLPLAGPYPAVQLGVVLVLCVPCTDWFITFTQMAKGDVRAAIAWTPLALLLQLLLLPLYVWWMLDAQVLAGLWQPRVLAAAVGLIVLPLCVAWALQWGARQRATVHRWIDRMAWWPVPMLALVIGLIATSQAQALQTASMAVAVFARPTLVFTLFAVLACALALALARWCDLGPAPARTLVMSLGTRNSFVMLPIALALGQGMELAASVIVLQSVVELLAIMVLLAVLQRIR
ncbi:arsenic resistance protein [Lampropedia puyangensis]|uniref:Arsenic resistance protein n=1 Tax=Lampropedia puyangensis TaxID=1330072 RepID=A0A4S8FCZ1_9BURK|nr:arsenic resistance protein [Lampropedia puyangensis]THU03722.1 arsenic resistance protein [Lampropedia puyangensis]